MAQLCRLTSQSSDILLRQGKVERKNDNFNRASRLFTKSKSMLKRDPKGRWVDGDTMFKAGFHIDDRLISAQPIKIRQQQRQPIKLKTY